MGEFGLGQAISRFEDPRLLKGAGRYIADVGLPRQAYAYVLRSPHAHARLLRIDTAAAEAAPGVLGVFTGEDLAKDGLGTPAMTLQRKRPDGTPMVAHPHPGLVRDRVRYVGDPVAFVVADTLDQAKDAAERIVVDYEELPSVTATAAVTAPGAALVWDDCPGNIAHVWEIGSRPAADAAFAAAAHVVRGR